MQLWHPSLAGRAIQAKVWSTKSKSTQLSRPQSGPTRYAQGSSESDRYARLWRRCCYPRLAVFSGTCFPYLNPSWSLQSPETSTAHPAWSQKNLRRISPVWFETRSCDTRSSSERKLPLPRKNQDRCGAPKEVAEHLWQCRSVCTDRGAREVARPRVDRKDLNSQSSQPDRRWDRLSSEQT